MNVPDDRARRKALRLELVGRRLAMDPATLAPLHAALNERLEALLTRLAPRSIGFTWPYRGEFDALPLMRHWLAADPARWAALPVVGEKGQPMSFRRWAPETAMATDRYGIPYPAEGEPVVPELLLIPCNGFDARGYRLGYGAGHYDRTLAALEPTPLAVGVAIEDGRLDDLQPQPHDLPMDWIVTEADTFASHR
ncbi:MAG: 5-formyltetrahydrofolate cyclo-ligase [Methyloversatilis discipulorum]|uniref:5-formyltetrahydrofolate cyclo-ligase n=1 Tax=Methyloversatilis discipulorum TaxID=1119528 RepID=UPI0026EF60F3|nr:5-formyltetrahydrofolate cyclo-ligase [Methyloversatilis discipulorum]MBT9515319.1 5-formyltetrahydrofolate cyclo-ligase [Methyloversatilis discipulorum]